MPSLSSSVSGFDPSNTAMTSLAVFAASFCARSTTDLFHRVLGLTAYRRVSARRSTMPPTVAFSSTVSLVVPAMEVTIGAVVA
jgi:hypothetical protein